MPAWPSPSTGLLAGAFTVLDDLMAVIEALCPSSPAKPAVKRTPDLRL